MSMGLLHQAYKEGRNPYSGQNGPYLGFSQSLQNQEIGMSTGYAACYIRTIFPNQLNPSNFVSSADCFVTVCMMETAAVVDGILN